MTWRPFHVCCGLPIAGAQVTRGWTESRAMIDLSRWRIPDPFPDPANGESLRRPPRHSDEALTGTTRVWLRSNSPLARSGTGSGRCQRDRSIIMARLSAPPRLT